MQPRVTAIGTIFMDCKGFARQSYHPSGRNLGSIQFVHGGVARNVVENLARLDVPVSFATSVDQSGVGQEVIARLKEAGVGLENLLPVPERGMGMWLAILDEHGNLAGSISQMPELAHLRRLVSMRGEAIVQASSHLVLELDLSEDITRRVLELAEAYGKPVYGIPGNLDIVLRYPEFLRGLSCFVCNDVEASKLVQADLTAMEPEQVRLHLIAFAEASGLRSMVITLGSRGSVFYDTSTRDSGFQPVFPVQVVDSSGAGDAFFSGTVTGLIRGLPLRDAVVCGTKVAGWTIESPENNCLQLGKRMRSDAFFQKFLVK